MGSSSSLGCNCSGEGLCNDSEAVGAVNLFWQFRPAAAGVHWRAYICPSFSQSNLSIILHLCISQSVLMACMNSDELDCPGWPESKIVDSICGFDEPWNVACFTMLYQIVRNSRGLEIKISIWDCMAVLHALVIVKSGLLPCFQAIWDYFKALCNVIYQLILQSKHWLQIDIMKQCHATRFAELRINQKTLGTSKSDLGGRAAGWPQPQIIVLCKSGRIGTVWLRIAQTAYQPPGTG